MRRGPKPERRCLHKSSGGLQFSPAKSCAVICVTAMLHIAAKAGVALVEPEDIEDDDDEEDRCEDDTLVKKVLQRLK